MTTLNIREWRSTSFSRLLSIPRYALDVYNALNGSSYDNPDDVKIIKVDSGVGLTVRNDATFLLDAILSFYEHQSTPNPNMPLRFLIYVGKAYKELYKDKNLFGSTQIPIHEPKFVVFYNGNDRDRYPENSVARLSDAYINKSEDCALDLKCTYININPGYSDSLKNGSEVIRGYCIYTEKARNLLSTGIDSEIAIRRAMDECINEGVLADFFKEYGEMIISDDVWDLTYEKQIEMEKRDSFEEGRMEGRTSIIANALKGKSRPDDIAKVLGISVDEVLKVQEGMLTESITV